MSSIFCVPSNEFSSGTGCPASRHSTCWISPFTWSYLVSTIPPSSRSSNISTAACAICHAAFPIATRYSFPLSSTTERNLSPVRTAFTASSGRTLWSAWRMIYSDCCLSVIILAPLSLLSLKYFSILNSLMLFNSWLKTNTSYIIFNLNLFLQILPLQYYTGNYL